MGDLWEDREIPGENGGRRIRKLRSADDRAIKEIISYYGPRKGVFRFLASRDDTVEEDIEEIDRIQNRIRISFNQQVAIARRRVSSSSRKHERVGLGSLERAMHDCAMSVL